MKCSSCKIDKEIIEFGTNKSRKNGLNTSCKKCASEYNRRYRIKNIEKAIEYNKKYKIDNKEKLKEQNIIKIWKFYYI
jgi:t-SNARE complex subunit (syntaxin)